MTSELQRIEQLAQRLAEPTGLAKGNLLATCFRNESILNRALSDSTDGFFATAFAMGCFQSYSPNAFKPSPDIRNLRATPDEITLWESRGASGVVRALRKNAPGENRWLEVLE